MLMYGTVRWFNEAQGIGVIRGDDGRDVKAHYTAIRGEGYRSLETGERVEFEVTNGPHGAEARDIAAL